MVQVDISTMSMGVHEVVVRPSAEELELAPAEFDDIEVMLRLDVGDHLVLVQLKAMADASLVCDRTLIPFTQQVEGEFTVVFSRSQEDDADEEHESVRYLDPAAREIELTDEIRDTILLSVPLRKVAPEADGADLVLSYGVEAAGAGVDPRWDALRKLKQG
jgi:uncharacterized protein